MLDFDYSKRLEALIQSLDWQIQLPSTWSNFFDEVGESTTLALDERQNRRMKVRTLGVLHFERQLPAIPRPSSPVGIYSRDFSRRGCGFVSPQQLYPREIVRVILSTFWIQLEICRTRRVGPMCYEIGCELIAQNLPSAKAFDGLSLNTMPLACLRPPVSSLTKSQGMLPSATAS